jgi:6,7-dimethyl-8-ribityllumazine synthase
VTATKPVAGRLAPWLALWGPVAAYMALIFFLSSRPDIQLPGPESDKAWHSVGYAGLGALVTRAAAGGLGQPVSLGHAVLAVAVATMYGATDEWHQSFVLAVWLPTSTARGGRSGCGHGHVRLLGVGPTVSAPEFNTGRRARLQGAQRAGGNRFAVIVSRFNTEITSGLLAGALAALDEAGVDAQARTVVWVPGAFELPVTAQRLAESGRYDAVVCLGCVIKGDTMHFEYIADATRPRARGGRVRRPGAFGVLTTRPRNRPSCARDRRPEQHGGAGAAVEMASCSALSRKATCDRPNSVNPRAPNRRPRATRE